MKVFAGHELSDVAIKSAIAIKVAVSLDRN